jgi:endonuclease-3 related protein
MDVPREVLRRIEEVKDSLLPAYEWYPSDPRSPRWWGGLSSALEIAVSAVLVQLSRWDSAIASLGELRRAGFLDLRALAAADPQALAPLIRRSGMPLEKSRRIIEMARASGGEIGGLCDRERLLSIRGIGEETADGILLFACNEPVWPASRLGVRVLSRVGMDVRGGYAAWRSSVEATMHGDLYAYKLLHAGLVSIARAYCALGNPRCNGCPLSDMCRYSSARRLTS